MSYWRDARRIPRPRALTPGDIVASGLGRTSAALIDAWVRVFRLRRRTLIGRDPSAVDIAILDEAVSLVHAELALDRDGRWVLTDLDTTNGTFVDGKRIHAPHTLADRQVITIGDGGFVFLERYR